MPPVFKRLLIIAAAAVLVAPSPVQSAPAKATPVGGKPSVQNTVTLISGDRVLVSTSAAGKRSATVLPGEITDPDGYITRNFRGEVYVIPRRAVPLINAGRLDKRLFQVAALVEQGYDDQHSKTLPLIASKQLAGTSVTANLPAANAVALLAEKKSLTDLWADLTAGTAKVWLDGMVKADMAESNAQIGSPAAWAAGYDGTGATVAVLDSGWDTTHPDLAGKVVEARNFTSADPAAFKDQHGHGTHVASTVAGTGAAFQGAEKGVAPGANLLIGRVLDAQGRGQDSWILAAMQWAVDKGADVVNLSLGGRIGGDCEDVFSQAAQKLTEQSKTLFVMSAGNSGPLYGTVGSPGCVKGALTVGAVDSANATAWFSSRGTIDGRSDVKPEISAPGVEILAANLGGGTSDPYTRMSGTSMASPHVAGVAAMLAAKHPDWTAQQIKSVLISSATPGTDHVMAQGSGVLSASRASSATVFGPGALDMGFHAWPHPAQAKVTKPVTFTNTGDAAKTFTLSLEGFVGEDKQPLKHDTVGLNAQTITVQAHGTAEVPFTVNPAVKQSDLGYGNSGGRLVARSGDETVVVPIGFYLEPHLVKVTIKATDRRGQDPAFGSYLDVIDLDRAIMLGMYDDLSEDIVLNLREGRYALAGYLASSDGGTTVKSVTAIADPELVINRGDKEITLNYDARTARPYQVSGDRPLESQGFYLQNLRLWDGYGWEAGYIGRSLVDEVYAIASPRPVKLGTFEFGSYWRMAAPELALSIVDGPALTPEYTFPFLNTGTQPARLDGTGSAEVIFAGDGSDLTIARGKIALIRMGAVRVDKILALAAANGVVAVLLSNGSTGRWITTGVGSVPSLTISGEQESDLRNRLSAGTVRLSWQATAASPYVYNLAFIDKGKVSPGTKKAFDRDLASVDERYRSQREPGLLWDGANLYQDDIGLVIGTSFTQVRAPLRRTAYYSPGLKYQHVVTGPGVFAETLFDLPRVYSAGQQRTEEWYKAPLRTEPTRRADRSQERLTERQADLIGAAVLNWGDGNPEHWGLGNFGDVAGIELFCDGESLGFSGWNGAVWTVPDGEHDYRLWTFTARFNPGPPYHVGSRMWFETTTNNWFRSAKPSDNELHVLPVLLPTYDLAVDDLNLAPATAGYQLRFGAVGQRDYTAGSLVAGKAWVSFDDGGSWTEVPVAKDGRGFIATVDQSTAAGKYVSLRVDMTDSNGARVEQTIIRTYGIR